VTEELVVAYWFSYKVPKLRNKVPKLKTGSGDGGVYWSRGEGMRT
jgi:hypothetical protein